MSPTNKTIYVDTLIDQQAVTGRSYFIIGLLLLALICDGFDLQLVGVAAPWIVEEWGLERNQLVGPVQTANLMGMMIGAIFLGRWGDWLGRKRIIVAGTFLYGLATLACLKAGTVTELGVLRFITGLGLGGVLPNVIALAAEITPKVKRAMLTSVVIMGMSIGSGVPGVIAAKLAPVYGWESLFIVGAVVPIFIAVLLAIFLPESLLFLTNRADRREEVSRRVQAMDQTLAIGPETSFALQAQAAEQNRRFSDLFRADFKFVTPLLWIMFAGVLLSMHFLNSWISTVLKLGNLSPEQFSITNSVFHWSGAIATIFTALLLGRLGLRWVVVLLTVGLLSLLIIATSGFSSTWLLTAAVMLAGFGVIGCQGALNASAGLIYPSNIRTTGVGAALGFGRVGSLAGPMVGQYVLGMGVPVQQMFFVPLLPLGLALLATIVLIMRKVDIRSSAGAVH